MLCMHNKYFIIVIILKMQKTLCDSVFLYVDASVYSSAFR